jgi:hypothetical protein
MDLLNLKIKESNDLVNFLNEYIERIIPLIELKYGSDISYITNFKTKISELNEELNNEENKYKNKPENSVDVQIELIFNYFTKINIYFSSIKYIIMIFSKSHLQPTNTDNVNMSQTYRLETNDLLSELISKHHNFIRKFEKFDSKILNYFSEIIITSIKKDVLNVKQDNVKQDAKRDDTKRAELHNNANSNEINKIVDLLQKKINECKISINLFTKIIEDLISNLQKNKSYKLSLFYIYDKIEEVKNSIIDGYANNRFSSEVNKHLHIINPLYKKYGLIPVSDSLNINDMLSYIIKTKKNDNEEKDIKSNNFKKMMIENKITIILLNHVVYTPIEYNIHPLFNADIINKYNITSQMGVNADIIKRFNCIKKVGDFPIIHWMHQEKLKKNTENFDEPSSESDDENGEPLSVSNFKDEKSLSKVSKVGGSDNFVNILSKDKTTEDASSYGSSLSKIAEEKLKKNEVWDFSYEIIGDNHDNDTFYVLESLAAGYYRFLAPWINTNNYKLNKFRISKLINFLTNENKQDRISNYNNIQINNSIKNMFLSKQLDIDIMQEHSKDIDLSLVKNILFNSISKIIEKYVNDTYNEGSLINNTKDLNDIIHQKEIKELFINSILKTYNLGSKYTDLSEYNTSKFPFSEVFSTFLVELLNLSVLFMKNLHDELNRFEINLESIFTSSQKNIKIIKLLNDIVYKTINNIINSDNLYYCLNYKFLLLNI